jgi:hypothetical protein
MLSGVEVSGSENLGTQVPACETGTKGQPMIRPPSGVRDLSEGESNYQEQREQLAETFTAPVVIEIGNTRHKVLHFGWRELEILERGGAPFRSPASLQIAV